MTIEKTVNTEEITLMVSGRIDTDTSGELRKVIDDLPSNLFRLIMDFRNVSYISSAGLRELLVCRKRFMGDRMLIRNVKEDVMQIMEVTGFDSFIPMEVMRMDVSTYVNLSIKELLERMVREEKKRVVLKSEHDSYSWEDIDKASQIIAEDLSRLGVGRGTHVGICGGNSINWILTFYALQKLGALAMLMNLTQSAKEIGNVCAIGNVEFLCYGKLAAMKDESEFLAEIEGCTDCKIKAFYPIGNVINVRPRFEEYELLKGKFEGKVDPDAPCVVIFTSGSTGHPKGVILSSYNLLNAAAVQAKMQDVTYEDRNLLIVPLFHILGLVVSFLPCAMTGAELFIPDDIRTDTLIRVMEKERCTLLHSVPTMIIALLNNKNFDSGSFGSLRCTFLAGAATSESQMRLFRDKLPHDHFMIGYGLSEMAPVSSTLYDDTEDHMLHTVGRPIENIRIKIQNRDTGEDMPVGENGEILIQGFNLMTGYYKVPIEEQAIDENGWLHTGDIGHLDADGYLVLSGRYKELIIRGGENIMPQEVADAVSTLDGVKDVKVVGVPSDFFGEEVCACVCLDGSVSFDENEASAKLKESLAKYKIPSFYLVYDSFPTLGSGKVDMVALRMDAAERVRKLF